MVAVREGTSPLPPVVQLIAVSKNPGEGSASVTVYVPGARPVKVWVLGHVGSPSSSRVKVAGAKPPVLENEKSCGSSGTASLMIMILAPWMARVIDALAVLPEAVVSVTSSVQLGVSTVGVNSVVTVF
jgi:hypothetical protein